MTNDEIIDVINRLEQSAPKEEAVAKFRSFGEVALYANREGFLQIGIEMLKCAVGHPADLNDIFSKDSDFGIEHLVSTEEQLDFLCK